MPLPKSFSGLTRLQFWYIYAIGLILLLASGYVWWAKIYLNPERVFWGMIENSLETRGVTTEVSQTENQSGMKQLVQFEVGRNKRAHSLSTLKNGNTEIKTEVIGTPEADYTRYRRIDTDQKNAAGKSLDVGKVINVWAKSDNIPQTETQSSGNKLFAQAVLGIGLPFGSVPVPIGAVNPSQRTDLLTHIRTSHVYATLFSDKNVKKEHKNGRLLYTYDVKLQTIPYVNLMKKFANDLGMHELDAIDANTYQTSEPLNMKLTVDAYSQQLAGVEIGQNYKQIYKGYGLPVSVTLPDKYITTTELQKRINEL